MVPGGGVVLRCGQWTVAASEGERIAATSGAARNGWIGSKADTASFFWDVRECVRQRSS